jgi:hypothetical protein
MGGGHPNPPVQPTHTFEVPIAVVPAKTPTDTLFGVSVHRMERFWQRVLQAPPGSSLRRYAALSDFNNCTGVVVDALLNGGLGHYAAPPSNFVYQDARTLAEWVEKAVERIKDMNDTRWGVMATCRGYRDGGVPVRTIPTLQEWKKASDEGISFFARRKEQIAEIDNCLSLYHRAVGKQNKGSQIHALHLVQRHIYSHLTRKVNSDRHYAVRDLAKRVNAVLEDLLAEHDRAEDTTNLNAPPENNNPGEEVSYVVI